MTHLSAKISRVDGDEPHRQKMLEGQMVFVYVL
jgi:hypothetical protein